MELSGPLNVVPIAGSQVFSTIVNDKFVDPAPYLSSNGDRSSSVQGLAVFRQWQDLVRAAVKDTGRRRTADGGMTSTGRPGYECRGLLSLTSIEADPAQHRRHKSAARQH